MTIQAKDAQKQNRFWWLDTMKGLSILWIVLFHFCGMSAVVQHYPWVLHPRYVDKMEAANASLAPLESILFLIKGLFVAVLQLGFHCVGIFIIASGFGLSYSLAKTGGPSEGWLSWYGKRFIRLYPMYWVAHLIFLFSPFILQAEPIDYRFLLSFFGIRVYPIEMIFYYANPAWWFFTLLIQLYAAFPLLYFLLKKLQSTNFLILCAVVTFGTRYLLLCVIPVNGNYVQGAFFVSRLMEFALGMVMGQLARQHAQQVEEVFFRRSTLMAGVVMYALGLASYFNLWSYTFTDALTGTGLFIILAHKCRIIKSAAAPVATGLAFVGTYSYGLYLIHQPYVLYFGERMHGLGLLNFVLLACVIIAAIFAASLLIEKYVNQLTNWFVKTVTDSRSRSANVKA